MKTNAKLTALLALWLTTAVSALAQTTAFTYQGRLNAGGAPANGVYDLQFTVHDAEASGSQIGPTWTTNGVGVSNGLFTTTLNFGAGVFNGNARWLSVAVRTNSGAGFTVLSPRQPLTPVPYALYAPNAGAAATATTAAAAQGVTASAVTAAGIASGQVVKSLNGLKDVVALAAGPNVTLATNANTLTISAAGGGASGGWTTTGNAGTTPTANFLGTTDGQPLVINAGSVGINTNDPQATLHVNGTVLATHFAGDGSGLANVPRDAGHAVHAHHSGHHQLLWSRPGAGHLEPLCLRGRRHSFLRGHFLARESRDRGLRSGDSHVLRGGRVGQCCLPGGGRRWLVHLQHCRSHYSRQPRPH